MGSLVASGAFRALFRAGVRGCRGARDRRGGGYRRPLGGALAACRRDRGDRHRPGGHAAAARRGDQPDAARGTRADRARPRRRARGGRHPHRGDGALRPARQPDLGFRQRTEHRLPLAAVLDSPGRAADDPVCRGAGPARARRGAHRDRVRLVRRILRRGRRAGAGPDERRRVGAARRRAGRRRRAVLAGPRPAAPGRAAAALGRCHDVARRSGGRAVPDRPDRRGRGHQRGAEVRRLPHLAAGRAAGPGAAQLGGRGQAAGPARASRGRLEPGGAPRRRAAVVRRLEVRLAGRARADHRDAADPGVPDGRPRPPAVLEFRAVLGRRTGHPARRRRPPDVPDRGQRRLPGGGGRPGARAGAVVVWLPGRRAGRLHRRAPLRRQRHRAGLPRHAGRPAAADGEHAGAGRLRADRGRAEHGRAGRVRPGLPGDHAARRGRAQLPPVAERYPSPAVTSGGSWRTSGGGWPRYPRAARTPTAPRPGPDPRA
jgi:hypothetical protein